MRGFYIGNFVSIFVFRYKCMLESSLQLTHCGLVMPYGDIDSGMQIGSGNDLLHDNTKPLPEPLLTDHHIDCFIQDCSISIANTLEILQSCTKPSICVLWKVFS